MDKVAETSILYDLYGGLLTEKKRNVMELYHEENLSLSEIAEEQGISRAAVHDALKSAENNLRDYEAKLGLAKSFMARQSALLEIKKEIEKLTGRTSDGAYEKKTNEPISSEARNGLKRIEKLLTKLED